jgi:hypothetical protein
MRQVRAENPIAPSIAVAGSRGIGIIGRLFANLSGVGSFFRAGKSFFCGKSFFFAANPLPACAFSAASGRTAVSMLSLLAELRG